MTSTTKLAGSLAAIFLSSSVAGQSLQVSPSQVQTQPQLQVDQGSNDDSQPLVMSVQPAQSESSVANANLTQVDENASVVFEVPIEIETDGQFGDGYDQFIANNYTGEGDPPSHEGKSLEEFHVYCSAGSRQRDDGSWDHAVGAKRIQLDENGDFSGTVKIGIPLPGDDITVFPDDGTKAGEKRDWFCYIAPFIGDTNYTPPTGILQGGAYKDRVRGTFE